MYFITIFAFIRSLGLVSAKYCLSIQFHVIPFDPIKMVIITACSTATFIFSVIPGNIIFQEDTNQIWAFQMQGNLSISASTLFIVIGLILIIYMIELVIHAPKRLKSYAELCLVGALLMGLVDPLLSIFNILKILPGLDITLVSLCALTLSFAFSKESGLAYIFPFHVLRLTVMNESGNSIFDHIWSKKDDTIYNPLFSSVLAGISGIVNEIINKGDLRELTVDQAVLLVKIDRVNRFKFVLVSTKSSQNFRLALNTFAESFCKEFGSINSNNLYEYESAELLIQKIFSFIPTEEVEQHEDN